jgi:ABC-2 type transport system permease protein
VICLVSVAKYEPEDGFYEFFALCILSLFILQLIFLTLGIFLGCALRKHKLAGSLSVWILVGSYFLSILIGLEEDLDWLKYLTPFKYFDPVKILHESNLDPWFVLLSAGIIVACMAGAYLTYARRDVYI